MYVDNGIPFIRSLNVYDDGFRTVDLACIDWATDNEMHGTRVRPGDVLLNITGASIGRSCKAPVEQLPANVNQHVCVIRPTATLDTDYLSYLLKSKPTKDQIQSYQQGASREGLNFAQVGDLEFLEPSLPTQKAIADFLDRKTAAIDGLIEKKQKLLDLLAEKRAALINRAVTKGLDPNVPMKDSGVPWIGEIPAHWPLAPLYSRYAVQLGKMLDASRVTGRSLAPYLRNANVQWDRIDTDDLYQMDFSPSDRVKFALRAGDILMCEGGANAKVVGRSAIWDGRVKQCFYQKALHRIRAFRPGAAPRFLLYVIQAACAMGVFVADSNANIFHLPAEKLRVLRFPFPSAAEQARVVAHVDQALAVSRRTSAALTRHIERLHEYRQALITAAVTGQLDIGHEAA